MAGWLPLYSSELFASHSDKLQRRPFAKSEMAGWLNCIAVNFLPAILINDKSLLFATSENLRGVHKGGLLASPAVRRCSTLGIGSAEYFSCTVHTLPTPYDPCNSHGIDSGLEYHMHSGVAKQAE